MPEIRRFSHQQTLTRRQLEKSLLAGEVGANTMVRMNGDENFTLLGQTQLYEDSVRNKNTLMARSLRFPTAPIFGFSGSRSLEGAVSIIATALDYE